jgi:2-oxoglutarate ferredoxin oxidoreductase subunit delta
METLIIHAESCKNCLYCVKSCPKAALSATGKLNDKGYVTVEVDRDKCICCGTCYNVCPDYVFEILEKEAQ